MTQAQRRDARLTTLLRDFGYKTLQDGNRVVLISRGIRGLSSDSKIGVFRSIFDAAEYARMLVRDAEFSERHTQITTPE